MKKSQARELTAELNKYIFDRPEYLDNMVRSGRSAQISKLAEQIKAIIDTKTVKYTIEQFKDIYRVTGNIKPVMAQIRVTLKQKHGIKQPRVVFDDGMIFCWENRTA